MVKTVRKWCFLGCTCGHLGVIFCGRVPDISHKNKDARDTGVFGYMCGHFGALMGPPMVGNSRYANPR